jgi:hypothetical protein
MSRSGIFYCIGSCTNELTKLEKEFMNYKQKQTGSVATL